jgi:soluble lytic murein transglycosylase
MMRLLVCAGVVAASLGGARAEPAPFVAPEPYFTGAGARAIELMGLERWADARAALAAFAASKDAPTDDVGKARLAFVVALCDRHLGRWADAAAGFDVAAAGQPLLADYARYDAAEAYLEAGDRAKARARAEAVAPDAVLAAEAQLLIGDVLRADQKWDEAAKLYGAYVEGHPKGVRVAEAAYYAGDAEDRLGHAAAAIARWRSLTIEHPLQSWTERARPRLAVLTAALPSKERLGAETLTSAEIAHRGHIYFDAMRNELAEADFAAVLRDKSIPAATRCDAAYHLAQTVFKERQRPRAAPLFDDAVAACAKGAENEDLLVRSLYQGGRCWSASGQQRRAIAMFERVQSYTGHTLADDAAVREAEQWGYLEDQGDAEASAQIEQILAGVPTRFPDGDMRGEALWRLAWRAWRAKKYEDTVRWLDAEIVAVPREQAYYAAGQTHYWKGRAFDKLGKKDEARDAYVRAVREYPLSYYALLAFNRLAEGWPADRDRLVAELKPAPAQPWSFAPRAVYGEPGFLRAVELLRLGQGEAAERELARVGLKVPEGRKEVTDPDQVEQLWATALLYDRAHRYDKSHWIARWSVRDHERDWPNGPSRAKWDIAYPRAYWHILAPAAQAQGVPPELLIAFVREESAFDPVMESFANAIGLTQMILPTAKRFGKGLGFDISRETLRDPEKNVAVGSRWLGFLWTTFHQHLGLVVAGYNAGEGSVWRWLCDRGTWDYDEFGEAIPFDETRNYTKRVLASYFAYAYLAGGTIPVVPNRIPPESYAGRKCKTAATSSASGQKTTSARPPSRPSSRPARAGAPSGARTASAARRR